MGLKVLYAIPGMGGGGGAERSLAALVPHWQASVELHVVTFSDRTALTPHLERHGVRVTNLGPRSTRQLVGDLAGVLRRERPDLVHTTLFDADVPARLAAVSTRTPVSSSLVSMAYGPEHLASPNIRWSRMRLAQLTDAATARSVSRFHALTDAVAEAMHRRLLIARHRIEVIPRGRDVEAVGERTARRRAGVRAALGVGDEPLVVAAARHEWQKGLDVLVRAVPSILAAVPGATVLIGGPDGSQTAVLRELVDAHGVAERVRFIGRRDDVPDLMCAADAFCVPSRWEGFASILTEAMALGAPTVASALAPIREVAGPDPWIELVRPEDPEALARGVVTVLTRPDLVEHRSAVAKERFDRSYRADIVGRRMVRFFERAAAGSRWPSSTDEDVSRRPVLRPGSPVD